MPDKRDMEQESLTELIIDAKSGDKRGQEELYRRFKPMICKMAHRMNWNDWEDAQQELIYELFLAAQRFEPHIDAGNQEL
ncbi:helix-turn-helix domain-containing protein [Alicyclobacillus sp. SO9]|uniref:helix-turn-helix domain-containing protein n=1 Tax=Alicyclobacillus sp. SO9 TaxID=2665646 RepID=UPI0018E8C1DF|nr:helix-turn-helix domain-containing protein [Alicyclobacillus sp. SO9]QQE80049.1 helix-turn-helix domain-containing protein [Alicyclobacillus sp. SO9]